uniref:4Fe-4S dicluster domain-containing protein n=1 Tax=uncultured Desulfovibrio sp. TaxID=167968 RepID=UPI002615DDA4
MTVFDQDYLRRAEARCTQESPPRCRRDCPLDLDVRSFLEQAAQGKWAAARKLLERHLPLPELFCRLCDHPCEEGCARRDLGGSLDVRGLEVFCLEALGPQSRPLPMPRKSRSIAVLGAGLAGLVAAWDLAGKGYAVTIVHDRPVEEGLAEAFPQLPDMAALWDAQRSVLERKGVRFEAATLDAARLTRACAEADAVLVDAGVAAELAPEAAAVDAATLHWRDAVCVAGRPSRTPAGMNYASASRQAGEGRQAARSLERLAGGVSLTAAREDSPRELHTRLEGISPVPRVEPAAGTYSEAEARQEAARCLQCQCLICVKQCLLLQKYKGYPRVYARQMFNNAAIVMGLHLANELINGCTLCGQCEELCPENFSMAELCLTSRRDMVERGYMPASAHEFALEDMESACGEACAVRIPPDAQPAEGETPAPHDATPGEGWLFFPGCQLAASRGDQVEALFDWLRAALAGSGEFAPGLARGPVGLLLRCCGIPARW